MIKFHINTCPLCGDPLHKIVNIGYQCGHTVTIGGHTMTHYQVELNSNVGGPVQHVLVEPYALETYAKDWKTYVYRFDPDYKGNSQKLGSWVFIMESVQIHPDTPEKLLNRIKLLVPFS